MFSAYSSASTPEDISVEVYKIFVSGDEKKADDILNFMYFENDEDKLLAKELLDPMFKPLIKELKQKSDKLGGVKEIKLEKCDYSNDKSTVRCFVRTILNNGNIFATDDFNFEKINNKYHLDF